jgi:hypothetical protein
MFSVGFCDFLPGQRLCKAIPPRNAGLLGGRRMARKLFSIPEAPCLPIEEWDFCRLWRVAEIGEEIFAGITDF